ncbi:unnamed protein product [Mycena citricolor]|uniref:Transmembrane protein n=1 Tax=Mycena citricolor TaxID=2018698 RepID=A0AAD2Q827_9AGAR|nr:unnamed protein product [Mycena citricolor]
MVCNVSKLLRYPDFYSQSEITTMRLCALRTWMLSVLALHWATFWALAAPASSITNMTTINATHSALTIDSSPLGRVKETLQKEKLAAALCDTAPATSPSRCAAMTPSTSGGLSKRTVFVMAAALLLFISIVTACIALGVNPRPMRAHQPMQHPHVQPVAGHPPQVSHAPIPLAVISNRPAHATVGFGCSVRQ